jgi:UDP-GlcNAc:undecaprenyl-phosphate GlcNAc-1-phosphate transferase
MGDTGRLFLGFTLACISIVGSQKSATTVALIVPIIAMGLPIIDTLLAILRRFLKGKNIFQADNEHIHHKLIKKGFSHKYAVLILYIISFCLGAAAFLLTIIRDEFIANILLIVSIIVFIGIKILGPLISKQITNSK